ncbi:MAG: ATP-binding cassette domain-containing protein, partial [Pseudomonadota bacterium]
MKSYAAGGAQFRLSVPHLDIGRGAKLALVGESGSGKSTLLELLAMILRPSQSELFTFHPGAGGGGRDVAAAWQSGDADTLSDLRSRYVGYVLQTGGLLPYLTVRDNINLSRRLQRGPDEDVAGYWAGRLDIAAQLGKRP